MVFKVDFEKTFDSVDWKYFKTVMVKMNFPTLSRKWVIKCVSTTLASVLVNRSPTNEFKFERGLRQGDHLSPFLFLVAVDEINVLLKASMEARLFTRYSVGHSDNISVSNLQFVDDILLLGVKSWANA